MSRPIAESLSLLSETLGNCKTNLKEKEVVDVDNIKISDVDEKIAEIKAGGGEADYSSLYSKYISKVEISETGIDDYKEIKFGEYFNCNINGIHSANIDIKVTLNENPKSNILLVYDGKKMSRNGYGNVIFDNIEVGTTGNDRFFSLWIYTDYSLYFFSFLLMSPFNAG